MQGNRYREVLSPPLWLLAFIYFLLFSMVIAVWAALSPRITQASFVLSLLILILIAVTSRSTIYVDNSHLRIGKAQIERKYLGEALALTREEMALIRTRDADPAAFLALKFWQSRGVKVEVKDLRDSTPYWLISSKNPEELAKSLNASL